ncbi:extracellular solute-binding protein [Paenibacillus sp. NPDC058071]|uniref:extracellular solute-binding protein n=1 Tax=Paenibacillus sp. NPDC058071 TaxID=3346326 RepID=UPI0036DC8CE8
MISVIVLLLSLSLAACGSSNTTNEASSPPPSGSGAASEDANTSPEQIGKPVTLEYFTMQQITADQKKFINDALQKDQPNITVQFKHVSDNYLVALKSRIAAGDAPDLFDGNGYVANGDFVEPGYVLDLTDSGIIDGILPQFQDAGKYQGQVYGIPTLAQGKGMIYNKTVFEKAGITTPPKTLDELTLAIEKLKAIGVIPIATGFKDVWVSHQMFWDVLAPNANAGDFVQWYADMTSGKASFSDNKGLEQSMQLIDIVKSNTFDRPLTSDINNLANNIATDKAGIAFQGDWTYSNNIVNMNPDAKVGLAPIPVSNNPDDAVMLYSAQGIAFVSKDTKHPEEAKAFLKWMTTQAGAQVYTEVLNQASPVKTDVELNVTNPLSIDANSYVQNGGKTVGFIKTYWPTGFQDTVGKEIQRYVSGEIDKKQFFKLLDDKWKELTAVK